MSLTSLVAGVVFVAGSVIAVDALADATQNRPDAVVTGTRSTVLFDVETRDGGGPDDAAHALWGICSTTVEHVVTVEGPTAVDDGWSVTVEPALGEHSRRRLVGCLEDATLDGVRGDVIALTPRPG